MSNVAVLPSIETFRFWFSRVLDDGLNRLSGPGDLKRACAYALKSGGKHVRPMIVYFLGREFSQEVDLSSAALSVEYFHTASLISDDMPCMDNSDLRRGKPTLHCKVNESTALLTSYALITKAFEEIHRAGSVSPFKNAGDLCLKAFEFAAQRAGAEGATGGQYEDLHLESPSLEDVFTIIERKTVGLFELSFALGVLFGSGKMDLFELAVKAGGHFGRAFQIVDDFDDRLEDGMRKINIANRLGAEKTRELVRGELVGFTETMRDLNINAPVFDYLQERLWNQLVVTGSG